MWEGTIKQNRNKIAGEYVVGGLCDSESGPSRVEPGRPAKPGSFVSVSRKGVGTYPHRPIAGAIAGAIADLLWEEQESREGMGGKRGA